MKTETCYGVLLHSKSKSGYLARGFNDSVMVFDRKSAAIEYKFKQWNEREYKAKVVRVGISYEH
jgi:hypothetical protein